MGIVGKEELAGDGSIVDIFTGSWNISKDD
jgi:hypothetical protein